MPTQKSIARLLGYTDSGLYTRGDVTTLYRDIDALSEEYPFYSPIRLTRVFLYGRGNGGNLFRKTALSISQQWPDWERDNESILLQVYYLFLFSRHRSQGNSVSEVNLTLEETAQAKSELYEDQHEIRHLTSDEGEAGGPQPIVADSMTALVLLLQAWRNDHADPRRSDHSLPGSVEFRASTMGNSFAKETIPVAHSSSPAWILRAQIPTENDERPRDIRVVDILRLNDGTSMLVKPLVSQVRSITYCAWTGGQNFTETAVAMTLGPVLSTIAFHMKLVGSLPDIFGDDSRMIESLMRRDNGAEDILRILSISRDRKASNLASTCLSESSGFTSLKISKTNSDRQKVLLAQTTKDRKGPSSSDSINSSLQARSPSSCLPRRQGSTIQETVFVDVRAREEQKLAEQHDNVTRANGLLPEPMKKGTYLDKAPAPQRKLGNIVDLSHNASDDDTDCDDDASPDIHMEELNRFSQTKIALTETHQQGHPGTRIHIKRPPSPTVLGTSSKKACTNGRSTDNEQPRGTDLQRAHPQRVDLAVHPSATTKLPSIPLTHRFVHFRFFSTTNVAAVGAISKPFTAGSNMQAFFDITERLARRQQLSIPLFAISMTFPGKAYPSLVEWRDQQAYDDMVEEVEREAQRVNDRVDVEIRFLEM